MIIRAGTLIWCRLGDRICVLIHFYYAAMELQMASPLIVEILDFGSVLFGITL